METLTWDADLASAAQAWAEQCVWGHDPDNSANGWGENMAMSWSSAGNSITEEAIAHSIQRWYSEVADVEWLPDASEVRSKTYSNPQDECQSFDGTDCNIGHYTQMVWAKTNKLGCAANLCGDGTLNGNGGFLLVCKYAPGGNRATAEGGTAAPWMVGAPCAACASGCGQGSLCDVGASLARCEDQVSTAFPLTVSGTRHTDCATLTSSVRSWCTEFNGANPYCDKSCGVCAEPENLGLGSCVAPPDTTTARWRNDTTGAGKVDQQASLANDPRPARCLSAVVAFGAVAALSF